MFGNRLGWGISGVIVLCFMALLYLMSKMQDASPPTSKFAADPKYLEIIQLPIAPDTIVSSMTESGNAGDKYREAIDDVTANPADYKRYDKNKTASLKGVLAIVEAGPMKEMKLFSQKPTEILNYKADKDAIDNLVKAGNTTAQQASVLRNAKKYPEALKHAEAVFALGAKLFSERVIYEELEAGLGLMSAGATSIGSIAKEQGDATRLAQCAEFQKQMGVYDAAYIKPLHKITKSLDPETLATRAGDVFALAMNSKDHLWRTEAMLQLGRMRYNVGENGRAADQHYAMRLLRRYSDADNEKDEIVRSAATQGRDLDGPTYNLQTASSHAN